MSFYSNIINNPHVQNKHHLPSDLNAEIHKFSSDGFPKSQELRLPPVNRFAVVRTKPQSAIQSNLFQDGNEISFYVNSGYTEKVFMELEFNVVNAPVTLNFEWCIDRINIESGNGGNPISVIRNENLYHQTWLFKSYEQTIREAENNNKSNNLVAQSLPIGFYRRYIEIPCFVSNCQPKINAIKGGLLFKVYFSAAGVTAGLTTNVNVSLCDILSYTQELAPQHSALENERKANRLLKHRFLNPIRAANETITMNASQQYNIRLTSLNSLSAYLIFHIRLISNSVDNFSRIDAFELLDENNVIVGLKTTHEQHRQLISQNMPGYLATLNQNIYIVPFCFTDLANRGIQSGFYAMSTKEQLRIYTTAGHTNGTYQVNIYSYDYNTLIVDNGVAMLSK